MDDWFASLQSKLETIEQDWAGADTKQKEEFAKQLLTLRQTSDHVVDQWLQFEEKLSSVIKTVKSNQQQTISLQNTPEQKQKPKSSFLHVGSQQPADQHLLFRKGEGFYHLRLFHDAKKCFSELIKETPDFESGRLYYAYSLLFSNEKEAAIREFRLLSKTASSPKIIAISFNAVGCLLAEERQWLEARQAFMEALKYVSDHAEARFNLALYYLQDGEAESALDTIEVLLENESTETDWEAQIIKYRAEMLLLGESEYRENVYESSLPFDKHDIEGTKLHEMTRLYEQSGQIDFARFCYQLLTERSPLDGYAWHGLAYTVWLTSGAEVALAIIKKAITLAPTNLDFLFTFGWIQLFRGEIEKARQVFQFILQRDSTHRLTQSGMITYYMMGKEYQEAKRLAQQFVQENDEYVQSLGYFHLGKIGMYEESWLLAKQYFSKASQNGIRFPELAIYEDICNLKLGLRSNDSHSSLLVY